MSTIPVIDLTPFYEGSMQDKKDLAKRIDAACRDTGFLTIVGHRVPRALDKDVFAAAFEFFDLPEAEKRRYLPPQGTLLRGYMPFATNRLAASRGEKTPPDLREAFNIGRPDLTGDEPRPIAEALPFYRPCIWPERPEQFRPTMTAYFNEMERLSGDLMRLFAIGLDLDETYFDDKIDDSFATLNVFHYPKQEVPPETGQLRAGAHTDFGTLTILMQMESTGGLEVMDRNDRWVLLPPREGAFVINIGDMMAWWTNGRWRSTLHRVANPPAANSARDARVSVGFFCHPNFETIVDPLPTCVGAEVYVPQESIRAGDWMRRKIFAVRGIPLDAVAPKSPT